MKGKFLGFLLCVLAVMKFPLFAQEVSPEPEGAALPENALENAPETAPPENLPLTPEQRRLEMEIKTSSLPELAVLCRSFALSESGTKEELAQRLREYYKLPPSAGTGGEDKRKIITIESARSTEYFKLEVVDEDYARLSGDVRLSLKDGDAVHRISAREILFNRTRNILTAGGGVEYIKETEGSTETFRGENITVNLDNWESVFLDGISERTLQSDGTTYRFSGTVITRNDEEVMILSKASISNASNKEAIWSLNASRVWLLPGSDFAIFNAVLKVGEIPVLYIPFFYYPADEVIFHPVIGFRSREGNFVQTTTYLLGRPKANSTSQSSLTRILGNSSDMEKKREGLFLRSTGKKVRDTSTTSLKVMLDYYANLGAYMGIDLTTPKWGILNAVDLSLGMGFTRTVTQLGSGDYTPFAPDYDGSSDWNRANLFSRDVPFRYRFKTNSSLGGRYGSLSWNFPFYSDPWVDKDFLNRAEEMDWINMIQQGAAAFEDPATASQGELSAYQWQLSGQFTPSVSFLNPYISTLSISSFSSTVAFKTIYLNTADPSYKKDSPSRAFFAPDRFTIYNITGSISGTPLKLGVTQTAQGTAKGQGAEAEDPLKHIGVPRSPWESPAASTSGGSEVTDTLRPPALSQRFDAPRFGSANFSIDYRLSPTSSSELQFRSDPQHWKQYSDVDWSEVQSILTTIGGDAGTTFNLNHSDGFYSNAVTFSGNGAWRQYNYINEEAEAYTTTPTSGIPDPAKISGAKEQQYRQSFFSTSYGYTGTIRPLFRSGVWGQSNVQYSFKGLLAKSNFTGTGIDPEWETIFGAWEKEKIDTHQLSANLSATIMEKQQNFTLSANLPPLDAAISGNATFRVWISETNVHMRVLNPGEDDRRKLEPFYTTETLRFGNAGSLVHYMVLDTELREFTTITSTLNLWGFGMAYTATRMQGYEFVSGAGWGQAGDPTLQSRDFTLTYNRTFAKKDLWKNRLNFSLNLNTRLFFDLQRYTSSSFSFSLGFTLGISGFLTLSLSATTENSVIFRYFNNLPMFDDLPPELRDRSGDPEQYNIFLDLINSFRFDDEGRRRSSGFKMKSFNLSATHHLGDWNAILSVGMSPYLPANAFRYEINTEIAFLVQWVPLSEIKSDVKYDKRTDKWTVK
jgi:hypothetical protein